LDNEIETLKKPSFMKNTIDLPSSILRRPGILMRFSIKNEKIVFWPELASVHYAKDTLVRLSANQTFLGKLEKEGLQQQLKCLMAKI
jgi:hypothetical protein